MEKGNLILMILALMGTASASSILMSNTSSEYEICVFDGSGISYGCANTTHNAVSYTHLTLPTILLV